MDLDLTPETPELTTRLPHPSDPTLSFLSLPTTWALQKPLPKYPLAHLDKMLASGRAMASKKYNGHRAHILVTDSGEVHLYQRSSKLRLDEYVPKLIEQVRNMGFPPNTLLDGEIYSPTHDGKEESLDALQHVISCGNPQLGVERESVSGLKVVLFDMLAHGGTNLINKPYSERYALLPTTNQTIHRVELFNIASVAAGLKLAREKGWEGCVAWDMQATHKVNAKGNTKRWGAFKIKLKVEEDFIATGYTEGTGQAVGLVGTLLLAKLADNGQYVAYGEVGSGLSNDEKLRYMDLAKYPFVVEVTHYGVDDQNRLKLPTVSKVHLDKHPREVKVSDDV